MNPFGIFRRPSPKKLALLELEEAELALLQWRTAKDYAVSNVGYNEARITRLRTYIQEQIAQEEPK